MTYVADHPSREQALQPADRRSQILRALLATLDVEGIRYCVPHGYENLSEEVNSDVDLIIDGKQVPLKLARLLEQYSEDMEAHLVQWLDDGAHFIVMADTRTPGSVHVLQLHVTTNFEQSNRVFYTGRQILDRRRRVGSLWVPPTDIEFGCILCNRIAKGSLDDARGDRLCELYDQSPLRCERQIEKFFGVENTVVIVNAAQSGNWSPLREILPRLRAELLERAAIRDRLGVIVRPVRGWSRRIGRWISPPCGLHVVFLGPDGVGKSTILAAVKDELSPAFLGTEYHTFAPSLLPVKMQQKPSPHALPPRGKLASLYKAAWWLICYTLGYFAAIHPARARSRLVLNHRYLLDAIVDRRRYRYSGPLWMLKAIAHVSPKADLVILLDGPPEVINARKREVSLEETVRQCREYRAVVGKLPNGHIVDASVAIEQTTAAVNAIILKYLRCRMERRLGSISKART